MMKRRLLIILSCIPLLSHAQIKLIDDFSEGVSTNLISAGSEVSYLDQTVDNVVGAPLFAKSRKEAVSDGTLSVRPGGADRFEFSATQVFSNCKISYGKEIYTDAVSIYQSYDPHSFIRITFVEGLEPAGSEIYYVVVLRSGTVTTDDVFEPLSAGISHLDIPLSSFPAVNLNDISGMSFQFLQFSETPMSLAVDKIEIIPPLLIRNMAMNENTYSMTLTNLTDGTSYAVLTTTNLVQSPWSTSTVFEASSTHTNWSHAADTQTRMFRFEKVQE